MFDQNEQLLTFIYRVNSFGDVRIWRCSGDLIINLTMMRIVEHINEGETPQQLTCNHNSLAWHWNNTQRRSHHLHLSHSEPLIILWKSVSFNIKNTKLHQFLDRISEILTNDDSSFTKVSIINPRKRNKQYKPLGLYVFEKIRFVWKDTVGVPNKLA